MPCRAFLFSSWMGINDFLDVFPSGECELAWTRETMIEIVVMPCRAFLFSSSALWADPQHFRGEGLVVMPCRAFLFSSSRFADVMRSGLSLSGNALSGIFVFVMYALMST